MSEIKALRSILNNALDILEDELDAAGLPPLWVAKPQMHPLDKPDYLQAPRLFEARRVILGACRMIAAAVQPPTEKIIEEGWAHQRSQALKMATQYNVAGVLAEPSADSEECIDSAVLAKRFGLSPDPFKREMRMLASHHFFREVSEGRFANNRVSMSLISPYAAPYAIRYVADWGLTVAHRVVDSLRVEQSKTAAQLAFGFDTDQFAFLEKNPKWLDVFTSAMTGCYEIAAVGIVTDYPWKDLPKGTTVVDIGGGEGGLVMSIAKAHPHLQFVDQDRPEVEEAAHRMWKTKVPEIYNEQRVKFQSHNFFTPQPLKGEGYVYVMRCIIHDWPHEECVAILNALKNAMLPSSRLLIIEHVIYPPLMPKEKTPLVLGFMDNSKPYTELATPWPLPNGPQVIELTHDIEMFCNFKAKERTPAEWDSLLAEVGMKVVKIWPTRSEFSVVEISLA
ncbi:S-adenosyl-L-methionine-dependent methyltransferase [Dacryopinax primogenitus]|uniref:S-adenosyl-L-methionine-dependent methyltransferase n=1 Tax=Dacryopinax primogenitus (strain DJM 731) TaxID=1858805 RepID=M5FUS3_DACPD|nr:S-adenosyl-L-methionine-dependent methyltransferase [Dacryopinax primogenitus]EJT99249.1 S-adenosyl-L-methionine-dependent methyltransferase [Dacryopinax primogenitus]